MVFTAAVHLVAAEAAPAKTNLVIGLLLPPEEPQAASVRDGVQLAVEQANKTPGPRVSLVVRGRVGQWGADAQEAARMALDDGATALIAPPDGGASHLVLQVSGRTAVPVVSLCPDSSVSRAGVPWFARLVPRTVDEARVLFSNFNSAPVQIGRWAAFVPPGRPGRETANDLKEAAVLARTSLGPIIEITFSNREAAVAVVMKTNAQAVLVWLDPKPAAECVKSLRGASFPGPIAGPIRLHTPEFVANAGNSLDGFFLPGLLLGEASQERFQAFQTVFRLQFKREPDISAAFSFDAAALLIQTIRNTEPEALIRSLPSDLAFPGVSGILAFDANGNRKLPLQVLIFENGSFAPLRAIGE
ncbi:MAG TPA: ABC transporter substrate-binding protein [Verrucomicrobiae bacterium]